MFDVGFSELVVIALVALIVIGPERLPKVARTVGALIGRAQRYVNEVKADIQREVDLGEFKDIRSNFEEAAKSIEDSVSQAGREIEAAGEALNQDVAAATDTKPAEATEPAPAVASAPAAEAAGAKAQEASEQLELGLEAKTAAPTAPKA